MARKAYVEIPIAERVLVDWSELAHRAALKNIWDQVCREGYGDLQWKWQVDKLPLHGVIHVCGEAETTPSVMAAISSGRCLP